MGHAGPPWARWGAALAIATALVACTSANGTPQGSESTVPDVSGLPTAPSTRPSDPSTVEEAVSALWTDLHAARLELIHAEGEPDVAEFAGLATDDAASALIDLIRAARGDVPTELAEAEYWPQVEVAAGATEATIDDCIIVATRPKDQPTADPTVRSQVWTGTAQQTDGAWLLASVSIGQDDCVPSGLAEELFDAYEAWHEAKSTWWDPPDTSHELLEETMVDPGLTDMRELLAEHADMGIVVRDAHELDNAVVFELGLDAARVSDCYLATDGDIAAYDPDTNDRREDLSPSPDADQLDRTVVDLERGSDGAWKVSGWRSETKSDCTPAGTPYVVTP